MEFFIIALGLIVGSFLNVCIYRLPRQESIIWPFSYCPNCKKKLLWYDNIPLLSYIFLAGRCRFCKERISLRYPLVEILTAMVFFYLYQKFRLSVSFLVYVIFASGLIIASFVDIEHRIIPDEISLGGVGVGLILSSLVPAIQQTSSMGVGFLRSFLGAVIGGLIIYLTGLLGEAIFKKEAMGGGDVKFLAMIGAFLGWKKVLLSFFIAPLFGALVGIVVKIKTKSSLIPYGPFLALGAWISLFWGEKILNMVLF